MSRTTWLFCVSAVVLLCLWGATGSCGLIPTPTPTPTMTPTPSTLVSPSPPDSPSPSASATPTPSPSPSSPSPSESPVPSPDPSPASGGLVAVVRPAADRMLLRHDTIPTGYRVSASLGMALAFNTWVPWEIQDSTPLWFPLMVESGKELSIFWDDGYQSSGTYTADIEVGMYLADKTTRVAGWPENLDSGYATPKSLAPNFTGIVYVAVRPYNSNAANTGSFALKVESADAVNDGQSFAWYMDGQVIAGANDYVYNVATAGLAGGTHELTALARRDGKAWSKSWRFTK